MEFIPLLRQGTNVTLSLVHFSYSAWFWLGKLWLDVRSPVINLRICLGKKIYTIRHDWTSFLKSFLKGNYTPQVFLYMHSQFLTFCSITNLFWSDEVGVHRIEFLANLVIRAAIFNAHPRLRFTHYSATFFTVINKIIQHTLLRYSFYNWFGSFLRPQPQRIIHLST